MRIHALILAVGGLVGTAAIAQAQTASTPPGPLEQLQNDFGVVVGDAFHAPDPVINAPAAVAPGSPGPTLGRALQTSQEIPGAVFAGILKPFADADASAAPAAPAPAPRHHRQARVHHHRAPTQG